MKTLIFAIVCFQFCLIQSVYTQCAGPYNPAPGYRPGMPYGGPIALGYGGPALPGTGGYSPAGCEPYGGVGIGNIAVAGELPVGGTAIVGGQVPIIGAVEFGGPAMAFGSVAITGNCGCSTPYVY